VALAATRISDGRHVALRERDVFPLASLVTLPILITRYAQAHAGRIDLTGRVAYRVADRVPGSGAPQDLGDGPRLTVRDLASLMIAISDNTAADLLLARLGKDLVERTMAELGASSVWVPLSIRELFEELTDAKGADYGTRGERLRLSAGSGGKAVIAEQTVRATPFDICSLFERLERGALLDAVSCEYVLGILQRTKTDTRILALLSKGVGNDLRVDMALAEISLAPEPRGSGRAVAPAERRTRARSRRDRAARRSRVRGRGHRGAVRGGTRCTPRSWYGSSSRAPS